MPKKNDAPIRSARSTKPLVDELLKSDREDFDQATRDVAELLEVRRTFATAILAGSPFYGPNDLIGAAIETVLELASADYIRGPHADKAVIDTFVAAAEAAGVDARVLAASTDSTDDTAHIDDLINGYAYAYSRAGYLLGLAVGTQLGPHAFDAAKGRR